MKDYVWYCTRCGRTEAVDDPLPWTCNAQSRFACPLDLRVREPYQPPRKPWYIRLLDKLLGIK